MPEIEPSKIKLISKVKNIDNVDKYGFGMLKEDAEKLFSKSDLKTVPPYYGVPHDNPDRFVHVKPGKKGSKLFYYLNDITVMHTSVGTPTTLISMFPEFIGTEVSRFEFNNIHGLTLYNMGDEAYLKVENLNAIGITKNKLIKILSEHNYSETVCKMFTTTTLGQTPVAEEFLTFTGLYMIILYLKTSKNSSIGDALTDWISNFRTNTVSWTSYKNLDLKVFVDICTMFIANPKVACCYIIELGYVKDVFKLYNLSFDPKIANYKVYKSGETIDEIKRLLKHNSVFISYGLKPKIVKIATMIEGYSDNVEQDIFADISEKRVFLKSGEINTELNPDFKITQIPGKKKTKFETELFIDINEQSILKSFSKVFQNYDNSLKKIFKRFTQEKQDLKHDCDLKDKEIEKLKALLAANEKLIAEKEKLLTEKDERLAEKNELITFFLSQKK